jgi:hypothetical protein
MTPLIRQKTASMHQKLPPPNVASFEDGKVDDALAPGDFS